MTSAVIEGLVPAQAGLVLELAAAAHTADGVTPLSEQTVLHVRHGAGLGSGGRDWLVTSDDGDIAGYAHLDPPDVADGDSGSADSGPDKGDLSGELVVHPAHRRRGHGTALVSALTAAAAGRGIRIWAHGDLPAAGEFAKTTGFTRVRELWQMLLPADMPVPEPTLPAGVTLRTFVPGADEEAWLAVNRRAFAHHPEQGGWTRADLELREAEPWFDPAGFFLAVLTRPTDPDRPPGLTRPTDPDRPPGLTRPTDPDRPPGLTRPTDPDRPPGRSGELVGFHWTKVHPSGGSDGGPIGEVYVVGVDPAGQGSGLGKALTIAGLAHLRARGLAEVMLYVDGDNTPAARLYTRLGFGRWHTDVMYQRSVNSGG